MGQSWTPEQRQVIDTRGKDILVSAAAGSGKTAVLVERIINRITDPDNPIDIDRLLVVTFTKAAAAEMRERVSAAIGQKREEDGADLNLLRQSSLIHNAMITTIDSFCLFIVRNHFEEICLDPNFRIADEGEIGLLKTDVLKKVFEQEYAKGREENTAFFRLIDTYAGKRSDENVKDMVQKLFRMSESSPWPREWLRSLTSLYEVRSAEELMEAPLFCELAKHSARLVGDLYAEWQKLYGIALLPDGPQKYAETLAQDLQVLERLQAQETYPEFLEAFARTEFGKMPQIRSFGGDAEKKDAVLQGRKALKDELERLRKNYYATGKEELFSQIRRLAPFVGELVRLSLLFTDAMDEAKRKKRMMDFSDIEHFALNILVDETTKMPRPAAEEFRKHFDEIMIDEYQDSNQVQEAILAAISREAAGEYNLFMVGDVKQSIYRFRLARPELFMEKYRTYGSDDSHIRIDLHKNFRSRAEVLDFANDIFFKLMHTDLGGVAYDDDAALYPGAAYDAAEHCAAEVLLFDTEEAPLPQSGEEDGDSDKKRLEARMVGARIKRLMRENTVKDKASGLPRPMRYSDIVILFRSLKEWGTTFAEELSQMGIPTHVESSTGYFAAMEVQTVLNMLRILDNPYQDIPMAAVLKSPMAGLDDEELAQIRVRHPGLPFAAAALREMEEAKEGALSAFYQIYCRLRKKAGELPVHELILCIFRETGYQDYAALLPAGEQRTRNLHMLLEKAVAYEKTSYKGLFHFVRYIDRLVKYDIDFGEADVTGENADVVHIMTIHKSKGLEFPVVFVSGLAKKFNLTDTREALVVHTDFGIGLTGIALKPRRKELSPIRAEIADYLKQEALGEELRVLYVALTRAKEKLVLTGTVEGKENVFAKYAGNVLPKKPLSYLQRVKAASYLDWLIPAVLSYPERYELQFAGGEELVQEAVRAGGESLLQYGELLERIHMCSDKSVEAYTRAFSYEYPYQRDVTRKIKYSVSELKHLSMTQNYDNSQSDAERPPFLSEEKEPYIPKFAREDGKTACAEGICGVSRGALRGTAVHRAMECLDFAKLGTVDTTDAKAVCAYVAGELGRMKESGELPEEMAPLVQAAAIEAFAKSAVASRMAAAAQKELLFKEKPFVMKHSDVLVQGIIDVFWIEDDRLVLLDYKTDRVGTAEELVMRYRTQLELYADALERIFSNGGKPMRAEERLIYSFALQEAVNV